MFDQLAVLTFYFSLPKTLKETSLEGTRQPSLGQGWYFEVGNSLLTSQVPGVDGSHLSSPGFSPLFHLGSGSPSLPTTQGAVEVVRGGSSVPNFGETEEPHWKYFVRRLSTGVDLYGRQDGTVVVGGPVVESSRFGHKYLVGDRWIPHTPRLSPCNDSSW